MNMKSIWLAISIFCMALPLSWWQTLPKETLIAGLLPVQAESTNGYYLHWYQTSFQTKETGLLSSNINVLEKAVQFKHWTTEWHISAYPSHSAKPLQSVDVLEKGKTYFIHASLQYTGPLELNTKQLDQCRPVVLLLPISGVELNVRNPSNYNHWFWQDQQKPARLDRDDLNHPVNCILLLIDTLRADHTPPYGHPFVIATHTEMLANIGTVFTQSYGASSSTRPSVGSIMTGLQPYAHGAVRHSLTNANLYDSVPVMAELFQQNGYETVGISSNAQVTSAFGFSRGFHDYECPVRENQVTPKALQYLQKLNEPFFLYLHYMAPHAPYMPPAIFHSIYKGKNEFPELDKYCAEITLDDQRIGLVLRELALQGLINHSVIWLVSDHGEEFWEHGWNGHGANLYEESVRTVSIFSAPHWYPTGGRVDEPIMHSDMLSTICSVFDFELPAIQQGKNLLPFILNPETDTTPRPVFLHHGGGLDPKPHPSDKNAMVLNNHKLVWWNQKNEWELYNLLTDPMEQKNLADQDLNTVNTLKPLLLKQWETTKRLGEDFRSNSGTDSLQPLTNKDLENLRANGYLN